jgi:hypothetical protein
VKRERLDFWRWMPSLRDLWFDSVVWKPGTRLVPPLEAALEIAFCTGALQALGVAMGYEGDDVRVRCLALQRQAAERLAELQAERNGERTPMNFANRTVKWRRRQKDQRFK